MKIPKSHSLQIIITVFFLFMPFGLSAQTITVSGEITKDTTWLADTVLVTGSLVVNDNVTLTIEPGTYVQFQGWYKIDVQGTLIAEGLPGDTITFTCHPDSTASGWDGLEFFDQQGYMINNDSSKFSYCKFEYGREKYHGTSVDGGGVFVVYGFSRLSVTNSLFKNNWSVGSGGCFYCWDQADILINNCYFTQNDAWEGSAIYC